MSQPLTLQQHNASLPLVKAAEGSSLSIKTIDAQGNEKAMAFSQLEARHRFSLNVSEANKEKWVRLGRIVSGTSNLFHVAIEHGAGSGGSACVSLLVNSVSTGGVKMRQFVPSPSNLYIMPKVRIVRTGADVFLDVYSAGYGDMRVDFFGMTAKVDISVRSILTDPATGTVSEFNIADITS